MCLFHISQDLTGIQPVGNNPCAEKVNCCHEILFFLIAFSIFSNCMEVCNSSDARCFQPLFYGGNEQDIYLQNKLVIQHIFYVNISQKIVRTNNKYFRATVQWTLTPLILQYLVARKSWLSHTGLDVSSA